MTVYHFGSYDVTDPTNIEPSPTEVGGISEGFEVTVKQLAASNTSNYILLSDGSVFAVGLNDHGQLGQGNTDEYSFATALQVTFDSEMAFPIASIGEARNSLFCIDSGGNVWANGENSGLSLSLTDTSTLFYEPAENAVVSVAGGQGHLIFLMNDTTMQAVGKNDDGQLGIGNTMSESTPVDISDLTGVLGISAGNVSSGCWLPAESGQIIPLLWGSNSFGQCGTGDTTTPVITPTQPYYLNGDDEREPFPATGSNIIALSCGGDLAAANGHTLALVYNADTGDNEVWATGCNADGQLGNSNMDTPQTTFIKISTPVQFSAVYAGGRASLGLGDNSMIYSWGYADAGALGNGSTSGDVTVPTLADSTITDLRLVSTTANACLISQ
jgi:alpha-tubulin suppressor-like RCC1 family protein